MSSVKSVRVHILMVLFAMPMRNTLHLLVFATTLTLVACKEEPKPAPPPEPPPAQPGPDGTSIHVDENSVEVNTEGGDVKVSPDSVDIDVKPK